MFLRSNVERNDVVTMVHVRTRTWRGLIAGSLSFHSKVAMASPSHAAPCAAALATEAQRAVRSCLGQVMGRCTVTGRQGAVDLAHASPRRNLVSSKANGPH